jgi:DNA-binding transcriptional regulator YhcF (GntR family)
MLDSFFGSKARVKVLKLFLLNPEKKYYLRQLARDLGLQVNSVRRELKNLETFGLLMSASPNNTTILPVASNKKSTASKTKTVARNTSQDKKYYQVNKNFVLFPEIKSLILKAQILAGKDFVEDVRKVCTPRLLVLSGIFVGNLSIPTDILMVAKVAKNRLAEPIKKLEQELGREINYTIMDDAEFKYRQEIADVFLHTILENKKIVLVNDFDFLF